MELPTVNGIIIQPQVSTALMEKPVPDVSMQTMKRSIIPVGTELPTYNAGKRVNPPATEIMRLP